jgi:uncharacterized protein Yka (UPF0111/DUF47 family)
MNSEQLPQEIIDNIKKLQERANEVIIDVGRVTLRLREIEQNKKRYEAEKGTLESQFDEVNAQLSEILADLDSKYPNGELDLVEGKVYFQ